MLSKMTFPTDITSPSSLFFGMMMFFLIPIFLISCEDQRVQTITRTEYEPVYMSEADFIDSVTVMQPKDLEVPGFTTQQVDPSKGLVVDWKTVEREEICEGDCRSYPQWRIMESGGCFFLTLPQVSHLNPVAQALAGHSPGLPSAATTSMP